MANAQGIDLSSFQPSFDWSAEKGRISFAFMKATEGSTVRDPSFAANWQQAKALGIVRGAYHFAHPKNGAATDSRAFLDAVRPHGLTAGDLLALDLEVSDGLSPARVAEYDRERCDAPSPTRLNKFQATQGVILNTVPSEKAPPTRVVP